jgi:hypothetical protein
VGGFVAFLLVITYALVPVWNAAFLDAFLVSKVFEKKHTGQDITKFNLTWTSFSKSLDKPDFMTRAKGLKRVESEIDLVKLIRKLFVLNVLTKHLISPA